MGANGTATLDFGNIPGTELVSVIVNSVGVLSTSSIEAWMMAESTATHNVMEHIITPIRLVCQAGNNDNTFTIYAYSEIRLTGTFTAHWVWI